MCSIFFTSTRSALLEKRFPIKAKSLETKRIHPNSFAPVFIWDQDKFIEKEMSFSLIPHWSKEKKVKFATHNARLYGEDQSPIYTKPTWKIPFSKNPCLIPMDSFLEAVHTGSHAGNLIAFKQVDNKPLIAAGIFDQWINRLTGEVLESFSILTHEPSTFILESGHDRSPVFLSDDASLNWPKMFEQSVESKLDFLVKNIVVPQLTVTIDRPLKNYDPQLSFKL